MVLERYPVCKCGHIFKNLRCIEEKKEIKDEFSTATTYIIRFIPEICPKCTNRIDSIVLDTNIIGK